jgi:hypothetical protein
MILMLNTTYQHMIILILQGLKVPNLQYPPNITRMMKSRRLRWAGHVTYMGEIHTKLPENLKIRVNFGFSHIDGRILLNLILNKEGVRMWTGFMCSEHKEVASHNLLDEKVAADFVKLTCNF